MSLRTLYLHRGTTNSGRDKIAGRKLFDHFLEISEEFLSGYYIMNKNEEEPEIYIPNIFDSSDCISYNLLKKLNPNFIYIENGLFTDNNGNWKIPKDIVREFVDAGGVLILSDVGTNQWMWHKRHYAETYEIFKCYANYKTDHSSEVVYGIDEKFYYRAQSTPIFRFENMHISNWLKPIYDGVSEILVDNPTYVSGYGSILASGNDQTSATLCSDEWIDKQFPFPFAWVNQVGKGFVVLIGAYISHDLYSNQCPDNIKWISNTANFLTTEARKELKRFKSHLRSRHKLFLSHRSVNKNIVDVVALNIKKHGIAIWYDKEKIIPSLSLIDEIDKGLSEMSHFILFWSNACKDAPWVKRELNAAISRLMEMSLPIIIVKLDETPVPSIIGDILRIEAVKMSEQEIADLIFDTVTRLDNKQD